MNGPKRTRTRWAIAAWAVWVPWTAAALAGGRHPRVTPVVEAFRKTRDAVVNITTRRMVTRRFSPFGGLFDDPFEDLFTRRVPARSQGSGVILHADGYVVTNAHVVSGATQITVSLADKTSRPGRLVSVDADHDLAVLKIDPPRPLPHIQLGTSSDLMIGERVIAVGNPLGYGHTLTTGVVSALGRELKFERGVTYKNLIQTDAPINPGNSGGPLLNINGEMIGINTAIRSDAQNIGFAIPVDQLKQQLTDLLNFQVINRVLLGIQVGPLPAGPGGRAPDGVRVTELQVDSPAHKAGIQLTDVIVAADGRPIRNVIDFGTFFLKTAAGQTVRLTVRRGNTTTVKAVKLVEVPKPDGDALAKARFGLTLLPLTDALVRRYRLPVASGLLVVSVTRNSAAHRAGIQPGDVVVQVDRYQVATLDALGRILEKVRRGDRVLVRILRTTRTTSFIAWVRLQAQ
jgi:serine protease Do